MQNSSRNLSVQASMYCDVVDANMENRRLRRALWIAGLNGWAIEKSLGSSCGMQAYQR